MPVCVRPSIAARCRVQVWSAARQLIVDGYSIVTAALDEDDSGTAVSDCLNPRRLPMDDTARPCTTHSERRLTHPCEAGKTISKGFGIAVLPSGHVELHVTDGFDAALRICTSAADPRGTLWDGLPHMITFTLDGAAKATGPHAPPTHGARRSPAAVLRCGSTAEYHVSRAGLPGAARAPVGCAALSPALPPPKRGRRRGVGDAMAVCRRLRLWS